jgi:hypothetical protein
MAARSAPPAIFAPIPDGSGAFFTVSPGIRARFHSDRVELLRQSDLVRLEFLGARPAALVGERELAGRVNFLLGEDPRAWRTGLPTFAAIRYRELYPGIDLIYTSEGRSLKSEFVVSPGADPSAIRFRWAGARSLWVEDGALVVATEAGEFRERAPVLYQEEVNGARREVPGGFRVFEDATVGFAVGPYEAGRALHIDPELDFSTFLGGASIDYATALAVDSSGRVLVAGWTDSTNFPLVNAFRSRGGGVDAFLVRYNAAGTAIEFATYLGGSGDDRALDLAVDALGQPVLVGSTSSTNFPVQSAFQGTSAGGRDAFISKLNAAGTGFIFSTYLGGAGQDEGRAAAVDASGNVYVGGATYSSNFPTLSAFQTMNGGGQDGFLAKFSSGGSRLYSTLLGGQADDRVNAVAVDAVGQLHAAGGTASANFPVVSGALQPVSGGGQDAFVAKVSAAGSQLIYSTYLGGSGSVPEEALAIAVDSAGSAYVAGVTTSANFPVANAFQSVNRGGGGDAFAARLNPAGSALTFSTFYGGSGVDYAYAVALNAAGIVHLAGQTTSVNLPMRDPIQAVNAGLQDAFVAQLDGAGANLIWASYLGGSQADGATAMALDSSGMIHLAGVTQSPDFPRQRPLQTSHAGLLDSFVARVRGYVSGAPQAVSVSPSSGSGNGGTFRFTYSDPNQHQDLQEVRALWSSSLGEAGACSVRYLRAANTLWLRDDAGSAWLGPATPGASGTLENSQCALTLGSTAVSGSGTTLTLDLAVSFKSIFGGARNVYMYAVDVMGLDSGWQQRGTWTVANFAPETLSVSPSSGSGTAQTFQFAFRDGDGHTQLQWVYALVHSSLVQSNGCYLRYTRAENTLWLRTDDGAAWLGPVTPGSSSTLENSQCRLVASASSASGSGLNLTVTARLEFKGAFAGAKSVWLNAIDTTNRTSNWQLRGVWTVGGFLPEGVSVTPSSGSANSQTFRFLFRDYDGVTDLQWVYALFDTAISGTNACYLRFRRSDNTLWLRNDANNNWLGPVTAGSSATVENTQCTLVASGSAAAASGATLQLDVAVSFKSAFLGNKNVYLYAIDHSGQISGWQQRGTWTVPGTAPEAVSVTPASGTGASQTFRFTFRDADGFTQLRWVYALFQTSINGANACYWRYTRADNTLWLRNDAGSAWLGPVTPGTPATVENNQCRLVAATSLASGSGTTLNVDVTIQFKSAFAGAKNVYLYAIDGMNLISDWQLRGTWTVP